MVFGEVSVVSGVVVIVSMVFTGSVLNIPSYKQAFHCSLNSNTPGHAMQPTVTPCQQATYCRGLFGSAIFPLKSGPLLGHISGQSKVVAGVHGTVVTQSSVGLYKHWLHLPTKNKDNGQHA